MSQHARPVIAVGLFVTYFAYLFAFRNEGIFHLDAVFLAQAVEDLYENGRWHTDWRFGAVLMNALVYLPFWILGKSAELSTILTSVLFHALSVAAVFLFLERFTRNVLLAALAAGLFGLAPFYVIPNTFGKEYGMAVFCVTVACFLLLEAKQRASSARAAVSGFLFAFSFIVREPMPILFPVYAIVFFEPRWEQRKLRLDPRGRRILVSTLLGLVCGVLLALATSYWTMVQIYLANSDTMTEFLGPTSPTFRMAMNDLLRFLSVELLVLAAAGLGLTIFRSRYRPVLPLALYLILTVLYFANLSTYGPRYLDLCALGLALLAAVSLDAFLRYGFRRKSDAGAQRVARLAVGVAAVALLMATSTRMVAAAYPQLSARREYNGAKRYALFVKSSTAAESLIVVMDDRRFIQYYAEREPLQHPIGDAEAIRAWIGRLKEQARKRPVYLTESGLSYDPGSRVARAILQEFEVVEVGRRRWETYHHAETGLQLQDGRLWRLRPRD